MNSLNLLALLCTLIPLVSPSPFPQQSSVSRTEKCNQFETEEFINDMVECYVQTDAQVDEAIAQGSDINGIKRAICGAIAAKLQCIDEIGPRCYNEIQRSNLRNNQLHDEFQKTVNSSEVLGQSFVDSCPVLRENEDELVQIFTGSKKCRFSQFYTKFLEWDECKDKAVDVLDRNLDLLSFVNDKISFYFTTWCNYKSAYAACNQNYVSCFSQDKTSELQENFDELFKTVELNIQENTNSKFSFQSSCQTVS